MPTPDEALDELSRISAWLDQVESEIAATRKTFEKDEGVQAELDVLQRVVEGRREEIQTAQEFIRTRLK